MFLMAPLPAQVLWLKLLKVNCIGACLAQGTAPRQAHAFFDGVFMKGMIVLWSGPLVDMPLGWHLCDGTEGTPDLRDKLILGSGGSLEQDDTAPTNLAVDSGIPFYALAYMIKL